VNQRGMCCVESLRALNRVGNVAWLMDSIHGLKLGMASTPRRAKLGLGQHRTAIPIDA